MNMETLIAQPLMTEQQMYEALMERIMVELERCSEKPTRVLMKGINWLIF